MIGVSLARQSAITTAPVIDETVPDRRPGTDLGQARTTPAGPGRQR
jgi:hypothetical protein